MNVDEATVMILDVARELYRRKIAQLTNEANLLGNKGIVIPHPYNKLDMAFSVLDSAGIDEEYIEEDDAP